MNRYITIHCADSPNGHDFDIKDVDAWHKDRGFQRTSAWMNKHRPELKHVGYHFFIKLNGEVQQGRHPNETGAHVAGHNADNIGICLNGKDRFTPQQWDALTLLVSDLMAAYPTITAVKGHYEWDTGAAQGKTCPNFDVPAWFASRTPDGKHILEAQAA